MLAMSCRRLLSTWESRTRSPEVSSTRRRSKRSVQAAITSFLLDAISIAKLPFSPTSRRRCHRRTAKSTSGRALMVHAAEPRDVPDGVVHRIVVVRLEPPFVERPAAASAAVVIVTPAMDRHQHPGKLLARIQAYA